MTQEQIIKSIDQFCIRSGMAKTTFGSKSSQRHKFIQPFDEWGSITFRTADKIMDFIDCNSKPQSKAQ